MQSINDTFNKEIKKGCNLLSNDSSKLHLLWFEYISIHMVTYALIQARTIINERNFPLEKKTLVPISIGGFAGGKNIFCPANDNRLLFVGDKFYNDGIVCKFVKDSKRLYGGDAYAMKSGKAELRYLKVLYEANIKGTYMLFDLQPTFCC